jgi:predicted phage tail protein
MTTGEDRRNQELNHPEMALTNEQKAMRKRIVKRIVVQCNGIVLAIMVLGTVIVAYIASHLHGWAAVSASLMGMLTITILSMMIAYNLGNRVSAMYYNSITEFCRGGFK